MRQVMVRMVINGTHDDTDGETNDDTDGHTDDGGRGNLYTIKRF